MLGAAPILALPNNGGMQKPAVAPPAATPAVPQTIIDNENAQNVAAANANNAAAPSEPAVLSSDGAADRISDGTNKLTTLSQKGTTVGQNGSVTYADGSAVPAPTGAEYNPETGQYEALDGKTYSAAEFYGQDGNAPDPEYAAVAKLFEPLKANLDANTLSQVNSIQQQFDSLRSLQQQANDSANTGRANALLLGGTTRYSPMTASGIALMQTQTGLNTIASLDAKENAAIASAQAAQQSGDMDLMLKQISMAEGIRTQKQSAAASVQAAISKANDALTTQHAQTQVDNAVADQLAAGTTDPATILKNLSTAGMSVTSDQIANSLKNFATTTGAAGIKGLTGDVGNFYALKATPGALPASILALPADQQLAAYISMVNLAKKGAVGTPAGGAASAGGAISPDASAVTGTQMPVVGFDPTNGPNPQDQTAFLDALPGGENGDLGTLVKGLTDYSIPLSSVPTRQYKGVSGLTQQQAVTLAKQYDPSYNSNNYTAASALQKSITSGAYSQAITAANTLIAHLALLKSAGDKLVGQQQNFFGETGNKISNSVNQALTGSGNVDRFNTEVSAVGSEAAKVYKGVGSPAESEISDWQKKASANMTPDERQQTISAIIDLMAGKLSTIAQQYQNVLGKPYTVPLLTPNSISILNSMGIDPSEVDPSYSAQPNIGSSTDLSSFLQSGSGGAAVSAPINWDSAMTQ